MKTYKYARPRGYIEWSPRPATQMLLDQVEAVLDEYAEHLPMTLRQVFYRLVGRYDYAKDERAYGRLQELLVKARRAEMIRFDAIRDDGLTTRGGGGYSDPSSFWRSVKASAEYYRRDRQDGQDQHLEVWVEAAGMVPQVARVASAFSVPVNSSSGFDSVTVQYDAAQRALRSDRPFVVLHIGDRDPSGESVFTAAAENVTAFAEAHDGPLVIFERVVVTAAQIGRYELEGKPRKATDNRGEWEGLTYQAEALAPDELANEVRSAIEGWIDRDAYTQVIEQERRDRAELLNTIDELEQS